LVRDDPMQSRFPSTTTALYKMALLADNGGNTKPLEG